MFYVLSMNNTKTLITILTIIFIVLPSPIRSQEADENAQSQKKFTSLHKSLLIPGWGQIAENRYIEGLLFLTVESICLYKMIDYNYKGNKNLKP